ncbi:hypothetical protein DFP72DRAFT_854627 [Ephemerocybe angulata]|uniref:Secreted protein n=1 Tax=Ephemerocybe angulata TaxID=980116 RepID=A0A8H6HJ60_9AGAR|nr:hypothetical protein DFP72DRAFT_854627 [Tulosesus angulatus]
MARRCLIIFSLRSVRVACILLRLRSPPLSSLELVIAARHCVARLHYIGEREGEYMYWRRMENGGLRESLEARLVNEMAGNVRGRKLRGVPGVVPVVVEGKV